MEEEQTTGEYFNCQQEANGQQWEIQIGCIVVNSSSSWCCCDSWCCSVCTVLVAFQPFALTAVMHLVSSLWIQRTWQQQFSLFL